MNLGRSMTCLLFVVIVLLAAARVPAAIANQPIRQFVPAAPFTMSGVCAFDVLVDFLTNKEYATILLDRFGNPREILTTGALKVRLTNLSNGRSLDLNITGPGRFYSNADGTSTLVTTGPWLLFLNPGQLPQYTPRLFYITGHSVLSFDAAGNNSQITIIGGTMTDLCGALQ